MSKQYNTKLQERLEKFLKDENLSQAKAAPILGISQAALSQYRRSMYDKGDIEAVENKLKEFFQIQEEKTQNAQKAEPFRTKTSAGYIPTTISEEAYKLIRYCQLEKGIVVIDGDAGIGKTKAAAKFLQDNPSTTVYVKATPSTGSTRSLLKMIAKTLKLPENQRTEDLSVSIQEKLRETDKVIIIDEAQNLKFLTLEEIRGWVDEDIFTGKPGIGIVLIGNVEVYNKMLGKQEAIFAQQFNRTKLHGRYRTSDIQREDVVKFFPVLEEKGMQKEIAAALAGKRTKTAVTTHCQLGRLGLEQCELFHKYGMDPAKVILGHVDLANDKAYYEELLKQGVNLGFDTIGKTGYLSDEDRADNLMWLIERGWMDRIVLSQDISRKSYLSRYGKYA